MNFKEFLKRENTPIPLFDLLSLNESRFKLLYNHSNINVYTSVHSRVRKNERTAEQDVIDWVAKKAAEWCSKNPAEAGKHEEYMFYSKSRKQSIVVAYRRDWDNPSVKKKNLYIVTVMDPGKNAFAKPGTPKIIVEGEEYSFYGLVVEVD